MVCLGKEWFGRYRGLIVLFLNGAVLAGFFHWIPSMGRPFELLALTIFALGLVTVFLVRNGSVRNTALVFAMVGGAIFCLEMAEKKWNLFLRLRGRVRPAGSAPGPERKEAARYVWNTHSTAEYLAVKEAARADGVEPEALRDRFAGDIFAGKAAWSRRVRSGGKDVVWEGDKPEFTLGAPLGYEPTANNRVRYKCLDLASGRTVLDSFFTVNAAGIRRTPRGGVGDKAVENAAGSVLFLGCSITWGFGLSDDETLPYHFAEASGFRVEAVNLGVSGYGPHQSLRDLELDRRLGRAGVTPDRVRRVVYSLFDDHPRRAANPAMPGEPRYVLEGGRLRYAGDKPEGYFAGRGAMLLDRGRILPQVRQVVSAVRSGRGGDRYDWELCFAIIRKLDALCRQRYGCGLTVVYWDEDSRVAEELERSGFSVVRVGDAFGADWRRQMIKFAIYDGHPSSHANRLLGRHLWRVMETGREEAGQRDGTEREASF